MVVVLHWRGPPPPAGHQEILTRTLRNRLGDSYRVPVEVRRRNGPYEGISPTALASFARAGIDDAVIVEGRALAPEGPYTGKVQVVALASQDVLHAFDLGPVPGGRGPVERLRRFADAVYLAVSRRWTAPGSAPEMIPLAAANNLYARGACTHAVALYDIALAGARPRRADLIAALTSAEERQRRCRARLAREERIRSDAEARFSLELRPQDIDPRIADAFRDALRRSELADALRGRTDKPAFVEVDPSGLTLVMRHRAGQGGQPRLDRVQSGAGIDLSPVLSLLQTMVDFRDEARRDLPADLSLLVKRLGFRLRLSHLDGAALTFEFVDVSGDPVINGRATLELREAKVILHARSPELLREKYFALGPLVDESGRPTEDALALRFFGVQANRLEPLPPRN